MPDQKQIDTQDKHTIVCPYCGHEHDSYDSRTRMENSMEADDEMECYRCGKTLHWEGVVMVFFSTNKIDVENDYAKTYKWSEVKAQ